MIIIYTTHENEEKAKELCDVLLQERIIACYNLFPIESSYWWNGAITRSEEYIMILKTKDENWQKVKERIISLHSYKIPVIFKMEGEANEEYENWVNNELQ